MDHYKLVTHPLGYKSVEPMPSSDQLRKYYNDKYYDAKDGHNQYSHSYSKDELRHKLISAWEINHLLPAKGRVLEVGVGEGFVLDELQKSGWEVKGIDFTADGLDAFHPHLKSDTLVGDAFSILREHESSGLGQFDLVICNHVLEHVIDPHELLQLMKPLLTDTGTCRITVPNDGSWLHELLISREAAEPDFYMAPPDHLHYFTRDSLIRIMNENGYEVRHVLGEYPIDLYLLNPSSNYMQDRSKGRDAHFARVTFETTLAELSIEYLIAFREGCASADIGRSLVIYAAQTQP